MADYQASSYFWYHSNITVFPLSVRDPPASDGTKLCGLSTEHAALRLSRLASRKFCTFEGKMDGYSFTKDIVDEMISFFLYTWFAHITNLPPLHCYRPPPSFRTLEVQEACTQIHRTKAREQFSKAHSQSSSPIFVAEPLQLHRKDWLLHKLQPVVAASAHWIIFKFFTTSRVRNQTMQNSIQLVTHSLILHKTTNRSKDRWAQNSSTAGPK